MILGEDVFFKNNLEVFRSDNGGIPIIYIEKALKLALQKYVNKEIDINFLISLCEDLYWEMADNLEFDETLYGFVEYLMEVKMNRRNFSEIEKKIIFMKGYLENKYTNYGK